MSDIAISVENISKRYLIGDTSSGSLRETITGFFSNRGSKSTEEFWALKNISFEVKRGEAVGIIGKNGAGKSTLLKILSRITEPTTGRIEIDGRVSSLLEVGTGFHPELTGRENVFLNGTILGMSREEIKAKFDEIVDFSGVEKFLDTPVKRYSSGMKVRLAFAVAAYLEPEILIIDEVLAVGDAEFQKKCLGKMQDVAKKGRTVLFVSHNMAAVNNLCSQSILLQSGQSVYKGTTSNTIDFYLKDTYSSIESSLENPMILRKGNGKVRFNEFYITNDRGEKIDRVLSGQNINFCFKIRCVSTNGIKSIDLGFSISDSYDNRLSVLYSSYQGVFFDSNGSEMMEVTCRITNFPFQEGRYFIGGRILVNGEESDWPVNTIAAIDVESSDFFGTGKRGFVSGAPFLLKGEWHSNKNINDKIHS